MTKEIRSYDETEMPEVEKELVQFEQTLQVQPEPTYQCKTWQEYDLKKKEYDKQTDLYQHKLDVYNYTTRNVKNNIENTLPYPRTKGAGAYLKKTAEHLPLSTILLSTVQN